MAPRELGQEQSRTMTISDMGASEATRGHGENWQANLRGSHSTAWVSKRECSAAYLAIVQTMAKSSTGAFDAVNGHWTVCATGVGRGYDSCARSRAAPWFVRVGLIRCASRWALPSFKANPTFDAV